METKIYQILKRQLRGPNQPLVIEEIDVMLPKAGEVLVKIVASGVCHYRRLYPFLVRILKVVFQSY